MKIGLTHKLLHEWFLFCISFFTQVPFLQVIECRLVVDPRTHESRGFGFVIMASTEDAERCIKYLNRSTLEGRIITVEKVAMRLCCVVQK